MATVNYWGDSNFNANPETTAQASNTNPWGDWGSPEGTPAFPSAQGFANNAPPAAAVPPNPYQQANNTVFSNLGFNTNTGAYTGPASNAPGVAGVNGNPASPNASSPPAASPWQNIFGSLNGAPTALSQGLTRDAGQNLANMFGANLATQNLTNMASPGSIAPSAPRYGLDFGYGDVQDAEQVQRWIELGESPEQINARLAAGRNNTGWGGYAPQVDQSPFWDVPSGARTAPAGTPAPFGNAQYQANLNGQGNYGASAGATPQPGQYNLGPAITSSQAQNSDMQAVLSFLQSLFGASFAGLGNTQRAPLLQNGRNTAFMRNYYYPASEPRMY